MLTQPLLPYKRKPQEIASLVMSDSLVSRRMSQEKSFLLLQSQSSRSEAKLSQCIQQHYQNDQSEKKPRLISATTFNPDDTLVLFWQLIVLLCCIVYFLELPVALTFSSSYRNRDTTGYLFEIINIPCLLIFTIHILVRFRTGYYHRGILITQPMKIARHNVIYLLFDAVALLSIAISEGQQIVDNNETDPNKENSVNLSCLLFLICKTPDLYLIEKSINRSLQLHRRLKAVFNMSVLIFFILFLCNAYACIFFTISINYKNMHNIPTGGDNCWIDAVKAEGLYISEHLWTVQYVYSLYWASTTMLTVGYGDVVPKNRYEVLFDIVAEFTSCLVFAYSVNKIWEIKNELNDKKEKYQRKSNLINRFMRDKNVKSELRGKVNAYLVHFYTEQKFREQGEENEVIEELAPGLREELFMDCYGFIFKEFAVFKPFSEDFFLQMVYQIEEVRYSETETIYDPCEEENDFGLAYLFKGRVESYIQLQTRRYILSEIPAGDLYGHYQFFTGLSTSTALRARCYCLVYSLKLSKWKATIREFISDLQKYCEIRDSALYLGNLKPLRLSCWLCESPSHIAQDCANRSLGQSKILQIKKYKQSENFQRRSAFQRRRFRIVEILNRGYIQQVNTMREFILAKTAEQMRASHGSEQIGQSGRDSALEVLEEEERLSERFDSYNEEGDSSEAQNTKWYKNSLRKANSQTAPRLRKHSTAIMASQVAEQRRELVVDPVPAQVLQAAEEQNEELPQQIDQAGLFENYFPHRNVEFIIAEQDRRAALSLTRRESKRFSMVPQEPYTALW